MIKELALMALVMGSLVLTGCQQEKVIGGPQPVWQDLTPQQQQQIIAGYDKRQAEAVENKTDNNAASVSGQVSMQGAN